MGQANSRQEAFWDACGFGRTHLVKKFIEEGININWVSFTHDCCPIHVASQGKPDVVRLLIEAKCDVNAKDSRGMTALHHAAMKGEQEILQMLIEAGCELNTQDKNGWTALHNAAYWAYYGVAEKLIQHGASVHVTNKHQRLALHEVARSRSEDETALGDIARLLVAAGSDVNAVSSDFAEADFSSLMFAAYHGHTEVVRALVAADCDINANGSINKWTALHWAVDRGQEEVVYLLVEAGADPGKKNMRGETPADRCKSQKVKDFLLNALNQRQGETTNGDGSSLSISSSQSSIAQSAHDTAVAIEKIMAQSKSSASASAFVPITMPPLAISTSEERKKSIKLGVRRQGSAGGPVSSPMSPVWSPGSAPHVELASDSLGERVSQDPNIQILRSFQDRLNRRIQKASKTLQGGLLRPEGTDPVFSSSSSESSTREQTPDGLSSSREATPSSHGATTTSQGSESLGTSSNELDRQGERLVDMETSGDSKRSDVDEDNVRDAVTDDHDDQPSLNGLPLPPKEGSPLHLSQNSIPHPEKEASPAPSLDSQNSSTTSGLKCHSGEEAVSVNGEALTCTAGADV
ncbi:uncharacterized protein LOC143291073 [Babylonia areolata]|uniref:uncharacterized protein LOC143291073 n=1 Tax=Babylonia areolata TaxID=304850 RepID=UPI003FD43EE1